jgi:hypothetical protein
MSRGCLSSFGAGGVVAIGRGVEPPPVTGRRPKFNPHYFLVPSMTPGFHGAEDP